MIKVAFEKILLLVTDCIQIGNFQDEVSRSKLPKLISLIAFLFKFTNPTEIYKKNHQLKDSGN